MKFFNRSTPTFSNKIYIQSADASVGQPASERLMEYLEKHMPTDRKDAMTNTKGHDPLCPFYPWPEETCYQEDGDVQICTIIAAARSDERRKADSQSKELWTCGDCGNVYGSDVDFCPNKMLDTQGLSERNLERLSREWQGTLTRAMNEGIRCLVEFSDGRIIIGPVTLPHGTDHLFSVAGSVTVNTRFPHSGGITNVELYMDL